MKERVKEFTLINAAVNNFCEILDEFRGKCKVNRLLADDLHKYQALFGPAHKILVLIALSPKTL